jgi:ABC-type transport system involved in multi-copper enzyme maturation permease subunit
LHSTLTAIALNTFRETIRDRILYAFVLFAFLVTLLGLVLGSISVGQDIRILEDLGLFIISTIGGIIAVFVGTSLVYKEIDKRTIYLIFTKPISRWQFVVGKFLGLALCILSITFLMGVFLLGIIALFTTSTHHFAAMIASIGFIYLELLFVIALATFFSTFATPLMSVLFTIGLWLIAHVGDSLLLFGKISTNKAITIFCQIIYYALPDLAQLTRLRGHIMAHQLISTESILYLSIYIVGYLVILLTLATFITEQREFQ